jgi:hypothetical protein
VYQQLEAQVAKTGLPREIISDHGTDLKAGLEQFEQAHPETGVIYDIKHKTAALLKRELGGDPTWQAFAHQANQTKRRFSKPGWRPTPLKNQSPLHECGGLDDGGTMPGFPRSREMTQG